VFRHRIGRAGRINRRSLFTGLAFLAAFIETCIILRYPDIGSAIVAGITVGAGIAAFHGDGRDGCVGGDAAGSPADGVHPATPESPGHRNQVADPGVSTPPGANLGAQAEPTWEPKRAACPEARAGMSKRQQ